MSSAFNEIIRQAGQRRRTVKLKVKAKKDAIIEILELEPYSCSEKGGKVSFFCLEPRTLTYLNIDHAAILDAEITERMFKPRFPVTL